MAGKILIVNNTFEEELIERVRRAAEPLGFTVERAMSQKEGIEMADGVEILFGVAPKVAFAAKDLKWLYLPMAGYEKMIQPGVLPEGDYILTHSSGAYGMSISEHLVMASLMLFRREPLYFTAQLKKEWRPPVMIRSLKDARITVLGTGDIGSNYARRVRGFEPACLTGVSRSGRSGEPAFDRVVAVKELDSVLPETDLLVMCLPGTPETEGILSRERIGLLPENACVINVGRGSAIDEEALVEALNSERLGGAALDVMRNEPLPEDDPLWTAKNVIITPHNSGQHTIRWTREKLVSIFLEDLENYAAGRPMKYAVDRVKGY